MIKSFKGKLAENIWKRQHVRSLAPAIQRAARRKLIQLDSAQDLNDLKSPPGNRLEALKGERRGQFSIRINDQYRICFQWIGKDADEVEIVDYH